MLNATREISNFDFIEMLQDEGKIEKTWVNGLDINVELKEKDEEGNNIIYNLSNWEDRRDIEARLYINSCNQVKFL